MASYNDNATPPDSMSASEATQSELDRQLFHLKTLYDVSRELLGIVDIQLILKNFLLMTLGNFGVAEGFIFAHDANSTNSRVMVGFGFSDEVLASIAEESLQTLTGPPPQTEIGPDEIPENFASLEPPLACLLTFSVDEEFRGIIGLGPRIIDEPYRQDDKDLLETLKNNLVVALKNARSTAALKEAYEEVTILNRAKDKLINHLAHELKTPVAVLLSALKLLKKHLASAPSDNWQRVMQRAEKNLQRLLEMEKEVEDIIHKSEFRVYHTLSRLLDQCSDELEILIAEQTEDAAAAAKIRDRIDQIFMPKDALPEKIHLDQFVKEQLLEIKPHFSHRNIKLKMDTQPAARIYMPPEPLQKVIVGLIKNAIENTPDEGKVKITVKNRQQNVELEIKDAGVGIIEEDRKHIFEGFFPTQEVSRYSSRSPFDFDAGGRGADLLRMKIFSERFNFRLDMQSTRCRYIPRHTDVCPGRISDCSFCQSPKDCYASGGTTFRAIFPA
ncbi:MAG: HAMP domain-containing sensor histidine kinase, partial [Desulfobacterales bacterium]